MIIKDMNCNFVVLGVKELNYIVCIGGLKPKARTIRGRASIDFLIQIILNLISALTILKVYVYICDIRSYRRRGGSWICKIYEPI
jgi:hypothetical protein